MVLWEAVVKGIRLCCDVLLLSALLAIARLPCCQPLTVLPLLQMSVLNFLVRRHPSNSEPVRAKEELIFHCGFRRFRASPLFSQHTSGLSGTGGVGTVCHEVGLGFLGQEACDVLAVVSEPG